MNSPETTTHDSTETRSRQDSPRPHTSRKSVKDPVAFAEHWLGEKPWAKQRKILKAIKDNRQVAVRSCNASGKTYTAALAAIWWLMAHEEALVLTTAPSERQVKNALWLEIREIWERNKDLIGGKLTQTRLELANKRFAYGFSTNMAERFQGFHNENVLIIVDEASGVREFVYEAILGLMTSRNAKILLIGNPTSLAGTFYDAFHKNRKYWKTIHIAADETPNFASNDHLPPLGGGSAEGDGGTGRGGFQTRPYTHEAQPLSQSERGAKERSEFRGVCPGRPGGRVSPATRGKCPKDKGGLAPTPNPAHTPLAALAPLSSERKGQVATSTPARYIPGLATPEWAQSVLELKGEESASYQIRVLGEFPDEADDTLIPLKHIENAVGKIFEGIEQHEAVMGLDVARFGDDQTVSIVRRGNSVVDLVSHRKSDLMHTTGRTLEIARNHNVNTINVDEVGLGSGVVDRIRELTRSKEVTGIKPVGVNGSTKSRETEKFFNLRTQMFDGLRQRFADGEISIPNDPELISQLASITYIYNSRGQLQIETKQQIRDSGRQSPDKADALALAFTTPKPHEPKMWILGAKNTQPPPRPRRRLRPGRIPI